jgi:hypothetical protein
MKITRRNLHIGAAVALVVYGVIYNAFAPHGNVVAAFFVIGLWVLSSFSDKTRWVFYTFLIIQSWANWHWIGLLAAIVFVVYFIRQSLIYENIEPSLTNILGAIVKTFLKQPFFFLFSVLLFMLRNMGGGTSKSGGESQSTDATDDARLADLRQRQQNYLLENKNHKSSDPEYPMW